MLDLSKLTEFNHALVYGFEPESSPRRLWSNSEAFEDTLFPEANQHQDMLNAYLYAQETILPQIKKIGLTHITPDMLTEWVKSIHSYIGKSLMDIYKMEAGQYTTEPVLRWHAGTKLASHISMYLSDLHTYGSLQEFVAFLVAEFGVNSKDLLDFITLLNEISVNDKYVIHESLKSSIDYNCIDIKSVLINNKLFTAYNLNQLNSKEKSIIDKVIKVCILPIHLPAAMNQWAQATINGLNSCDFTSLDKVSDFLATAFYKLTDIHPFANANGRTATCLINIFLRASNYPSILLRLPGERGNQQSAYEKAFAEIDSSLLPLKELISLRITEAQNKEFMNKQLKKIIELRVNLSNLLQETKQKYPKFNVSEFQEKVSYAPEIFLAMRMPNETDASILMLSVALSMLSQEIKDLEKTKQIKSPLFFSPPALDTKQVIHSLETISGQTGWKHSSKNEFVAWLELQDKDKAKAKEIVSKLQVTEAAEFTLRQRADNKNSIVKCDKINLKKLIDSCQALNVCSKARP